VNPAVRRLGRAALIGVVLVALALFARRVQWGETWTAIRSASLVVLAVATAVNLLSLVLKAVRWWLFLRPAGVTSLPLVLRATFAGAAFNNILIANAGDAGRVLLVARSARVPTETVLATMALERLFEFAGYVLMLATAVSVLRLPPALNALRPYAFLVLVVVIGFLVYLIRHPEKDLPAMETGGAGSGRIARYGRGFFRALSGVSSGRRFAAAMVLAVACWALQVATYHLTARAAHFDIPVVGTIAALLAVNVGFAVRATPGNLGVFQAMYALAASAFGMDKDAAIGVALLIQAQQILPITVIGLVAAPRFLAKGSEKVEG
jgi:glycosyltransferase 2 family protein